MLWKKRYDRKKKEYIFTWGGEDRFRIFRSGLGGDIEWTAGDMEGHEGYSYRTFRQAVLDFMGWNDFKEYMRKRLRP